MNPTKTGLYATYADDRSVLLYWDGDDWVDQDGIRPRYKKVQWTGKPLIAISELEHLREEIKNCHQIIKDLQMKREWVGLTPEDLALVLAAIEHYFKERNT